MKKFMAVLVASLIVLVFASVSFAAWVTGGIAVNPAANAIIADTGAAVEGSHDWDLIVCSTAATAVVVEWRDATNTTNLWSQIVPIAANSCSPPMTQRGSLWYTTGERMRVRMNAALTGSVQASINFF